MARLSVVQNVGVASPCPASWDTMTGDEQVRFCGQCKLHVYNISAMSTEAAEALLLEREGRLCVRYFQRADGTILTQDCPVGLRLVRQKLMRLVGGLAAAIAFVFGGLHVLARGPNGSGQMRLRFFEPLASVADWAKRSLSPPIFAAGGWTTGIRIAPTHDGFSEAERAEIAVLARERMLRDPNMHGLNIERAQFAAELDAMLQIQERQFEERLKEWTASQSASQSH